MRKITLGALALMFGAVGFAQNNTGTVNQTGNDNTGIVDQTGSENQGTITSDGNLNKDDIVKWGNWKSGVSAYMMAKGITQKGYKNTGSIDQNSGPATGAGNRAGIGQDGKLNNAKITQSDPSSHTWGPENNAFVDQLGDNNISVQNQEGKANNSYFRQDGNGNEAESQQFDYYTSRTTVEQVGDNNTSFQRQEFGNSTGNNKSNVYQKGNMNNANSDQRGKGNEGVISQTGGNLNDSELSQFGDGNDAGIMQNGSNNQALVYQGWAYAPIWGSTEVVGNNNQASVNQNGENNFGGIWSMGSDNIVNLDQVGDNNVARLSNGYNYSTVNGVPGINPANSNTIELEQIGSNNWVRNFQLGDNNLLRLKQNGNGNTVGGRTPRSSTLPDGRNARAEYFQQYGDNNKLAGVLKSGDNLSFDEAGFAEQNDGSTLDAASYQFGNDNIIGLRQGEGDMGLIQQDGNDNSALLWQDYSNDATIIQSGNMNSAEISQSRL